MIIRIIFLPCILFACACTFAVDPIDFTKRAVTIESKNFPSRYSNNFDTKLYENNILEMQSYQDSKALYKSKIAPIKEQKIENKLLYMGDMIQTNRLFEKQDYSEIKATPIKTPLYKRFLSKFWGKTKDAQVISFDNNDYELITKEISLQSINRFAFRRNHSLEPSLPIQEAGNN